MGWIVLLFLLGLAAFVGAAVVVAVSRGRHMRMLVERGVPVTGTVVRRFATGRAGKTERTKRIAFTYRGPDGREYRRAASMTRARWDQYEEGAPIELICLPDDPGVSAEAWLVEKAREAMEGSRTRS